MIEKYIKAMRKKPEIEEKRITLREEKNKKK